MSLYTNDTEGHIASAVFSLGLVSRLCEESTDRDALRLTLFDLVDLAAFLADVTETVARALDKEPAT